MDKQETRGLTVIFTGDGKGKTSAMLGAVMRALGHGMKCKVIQFIKANSATGELETAKRLAPQLEIVQAGLGFTWLPGHGIDEHEKAAQAGLALAMEALASADYGLVAMDEALYALKKGLVSLDQLKQAVLAKPAHTHLILTGRGAPQELVELADMVTSMESVKHPMSKGIPAQPGLDY
ncbi:MAG: cob(I)yrinic acid a,c-diamide adenosyltransferase [Nitrospinae bacterium]|nr:cob(I)yrinic acid a,c-diamide adenosyltransferase [Nitrospinota bacterium]